MKRTLTLDDCRQAFVADGSLRDLYVIPASLGDWHRFMDFTACFPREFEVDGVASEVPDRIEPALNDSQHAYLMRLRLADLSVHCHFFTPDEIELDLDPAEITTQHAFAALMDFMQGLGKALGKDVILTHENSSQHVLLRYDFSASRFVHAF